MKVPATAIIRTLYFYRCHSFFLPNFYSTILPPFSFVVNSCATSPNISNNYDNALPMGIAVFASAIDCLKGVDTVYDSYVNELELGKKRIMVKPAAMEHISGEPCFGPNDLIYYTMSEDTVNGSIIQPIDMKLRVPEHNAGIQDMLNALSSRCGFGERHYKFDSGSIATATQVISENSTLFRMKWRNEDETTAKVALPKWRI